jgi:hypothetical protein
MEFTANVRFVEDPLFANLPCHDIVRSLPADYPGYLVFVVDARSDQGNEHSLLVVGFSPQGDDPKDFARKPNQTPLEEIRSFRALPSTIQSIENNLTIANMETINLYRLQTRCLRMRGASANPYSILLEE